VISVAFHHSNLELPIGIERRLTRVMVTPRMHGIHHSTRPTETDSNYSSLLSWWDRLHGSLRLDVPQASVTIGVPGFERREDVTLVNSLSLPFRRDPRLLPPAAAVLRRKSEAAPER
jgi:sterol desaturase/sphingolipid hydroxylase (fatty acid hydroxylase superfamily)